MAIRVASMGSAPAPATSALDEELMAAREVARASVCFFDNVSPLAGRLGIDGFPSFDTFMSRFSETEDVNTHRLRADGRILQRVHTAAAAQVSYQHEQDAPLADCWPDGSGTAARQRLLAHLPRADADLTSLGELATGLLVAADCIDISRVAKFTAIGSIDANILLGMPISAWTDIVESLAAAPREELRAAITAAVNLFTSSVNTCDKAVEAILSGVCTGLQGIDTTEYPCGQPSPCAPADTPEPAVGAGPVCADSPAVTGGPGGPGGSAGPSSGGTRAESTSAPLPISAAPPPDPRAGAVIAAGSSSAAGQFTSASGPAPEGAELTGLTGLLGPLVGAVSEAVAGAVIGVVEAVVSVQSEGHPVQAVDGPAGVPQTVGPPDVSPPASGEKTFTLELGDDGRSLSLTVGGGGTPPDHSDDGAGPGDDGSPGRGPQECTQGPEQSDQPVSVGPAEGAATTEPSETDEPSETESSPLASEPGTEACPSPAATPGNASGVPTPIPRPARLPEPSTQVAPQATDPRPPAPGDEGVLALAGDQ
ncbi:MAG: hypothetical protein C0482_07095 [Gordonia sp.]|uniref:hypothetical protein n=1 Tax=Williamsia sp. 1138 TaxID=1903117 RepID=UPI000A1008FE|nr:hypothetical protein [Williamsia sp. 1138]MBA4022115.1 hypothetical protein [Gordonia sp. (in: high G+C Gram-positive bacteria)]OZG27064.1 hypothetical protein BH683_021815 [Williamsia sp. 1138]